MAGEQLIPIVKAAIGAAAPAMAIGNTLADVWQGIIGDRVAGWRLKNIANINLQLIEHLAVSGLFINRDKIPDRYAFSWFDEASKQDEPEVQALFAKLLANAATGNADALNCQNIDILARMSPSDAVALRAISSLMSIYDDADGKTGIFIARSKYHVLECVERAGTRDPELNLDSLIALGVLEKSSQIDNSKLRNVLQYMTQKNVNVSIIEYKMRDVLEMQDHIEVTARGKSLIHALIPDLFG